MQTESEVIGTYCITVFESRIFWKGYYDCKKLRDVVAIGIKIKIITIKAQGFEIKKLKGVIFSSS